eukprot:9684889-Alexandrium_andersonii.AAC.1
MSRTSKPGRSSSAPSRLFAIPASTNPCWRVCGALAAMRQGTCPTPSDERCSGERPPAATAPRLPLSPGACKRRTTGRAAERRRAARDP